MTHFHEIYLNLFALNTVVKEVTALRESARIIKEDFQSIIGYTILLNSNKNQKFLRPEVFHSLNYPSGVFLLFISLINKLLDIQTVSISRKFDKSNQ